MLSEDLIKLYNTLNLIETKGENTKLMAQCIVFVEQLANEAKMSEIEAAKAAKTNKTSSEKKEGK